MSEKIRRKKSWLIETISPSGECINYYASMSKKKFMEMFPGVVIKSMKFVKTPREILKYFEKSGKNYIRFKKAYK